MQNIDKLPGIGSIANANNTNAADKVSSGDFSKVLKDSLADVNERQIKGDKAMADIATGEVKNLHQAALAIGKAETSMKLMLEVRNKALSAYKEISKTQM